MLAPHHHPPTHTQHESYCTTKCFPSSNTITTPPQPTHPLQTHHHHRAAAAPAAFGYTIPIPTLYTIAAASHTHIPTQTTHMPKSSHIHPRILTLTIPKLPSLEMADEQQFNTRTIKKWLNREKNQPNAHS